MFLAKKLFSLLFSYRRASVTLTLESCVLASPTSAILNEEIRVGTSRMHVNIHVNAKYINETVIASGNILHIVIVVPSDV